MKKLYNNCNTCNTLMFTYLKVSKLRYLLKDWETFNRYPALKKCNQNLQTSMMVILTKIVGNVNSKTYF